jgi:hypothetical protein
VKYTDVFVVGTLEEVQQAVAYALHAHGLEVEWADYFSGKATHGSKGANVAVGAFAQYYEVDFQILQLPDQSIAVRLFKSNSGWMGGAIGAYKVGKRYDEVVRSVCDYFQFQGRLRGTDPP